jgi:predicted RNA-binding Zn ribbon-like protein
MSKESRRFKVPDELADLYDFANTLDLRHFTHHGVVHPQGDELADTAGLATWMSQRGLLAAGAKVPGVTFEAALRFRACLRDYLQRDPAERGRNKDAVRSLNEALRLFPLAVEVRSGGTMALRAAREDALTGLSSVVAQLYDGFRNGTLDRLKMCASDECRRVFFDRSKPATRRWCMSSLCGNRIKTRNYRARHRVG